jgi:hypothetical protein
LQVYSLNGKSGLLLAALILLIACRSTRPLRPEARYDMSTSTIPLSSIYIPVHITRADLKQMVNRAVSGLSLDNQAQPMDGFTWSMAIRREVRVELEGQQIHTVLPIDVHLRKELGITALRANGELQLGLKTLFNIREDWSVQTHTTLVEHQWLRRPVAQVAGMNIPVSGLTNLIIDYSRPRLTRAIDQQIRENVDLRALLAPLWTVLRRPVQVSESMDLWFRFEPRLAGMEPFDSDASGLHSAVHLSGVARLKAGGAPSLIDPEKDPQFALQHQQRKDSLRIPIHTEIPWAQAERIATQNIVGKTFGSKGQEVSVQAIELYGQDDQLIISAKLSGNYKGTVHLRGRPWLNLQKNQVELADLDFDMHTRNVLHRSAAWLFKANIRSSLEKALVFPLEEDIGMVSREIRTAINQFQPGPWIRMEAGPLDLRMEAIRLTPEGMVLDFLLAGRMDIHLKALE